MTDDGTPVPASGAGHRITARDLHEERLEASAEKHAGDCNSKSPSFLEADGGVVADLLDELSPEAFEREWRWLERKQLKAELEDRFTDAPRSTDLPEQILDELTSGTERTDAGPESESGNPATSETSLDDFL